MNALYCLKLSKKDRLFAKARDCLQDELEIVLLLRKLRFVKAAISTLITPQRVNQLKLENDKQIIGKAKKEVIKKRYFDPVPDSTQN